jgi:hypothetical protein
MSNWENFKPKLQVPSKKGSKSSLKELLTEVA